MKRLLIFIIFLTTANNYIQAQNKTDNRLWLHYMSSASLASKWSLDTDAAYMKMFQKPVDRFQVRSGIKYKFNSNFSLRLGGGYFYIFGDESSNNSEIRPMQDLIGTHKVSNNGSLFIKQRVRFEQQIFNSKLNEGTEDEINHRVRYSFILRKKFDKWLLGVGNESFTNFEEKDDTPFINKNRAIALINRSLTDLISIETQYIREDSFVKNEGSIHHSNLVRLAVRHKIQ